MLICLSNYSFPELMNPGLTSYNSRKTVSVWHFIVNILFHSSYLHHEYHSVESDHDHDGVLKRSRDHKLPHPVLEGLRVLRHVACQRFGINGKVNTGSL